MNLSPFGSDKALRDRLIRKLDEIEDDDRDIEREGLESLTHGELKAACRERGMRAHGLTTQGYRRNLKQWITLHLHQKVPASLLILSRVMAIQERCVCGGEQQLLSVILSIGSSRVVGCRVSRAPGNLLSCPWRRRYRPWIRMWSMKCWWRHHAMLTR